MTASQLVQQLAGKNKARIIFDVGAAEGFVTRNFLKTFPNAIVYAFEPALGLCNLKSGKRIKVSKKAVLDREGITQFYLNSKKRTSSILPFTPKFKRAWTKRIVEIPCVTLDGFCSRNKIRRIDVLKIDVQGAELQVLHGARRLFEKGAIGIIVMELQKAPVYVGQSKREAVGKFLSRHGFMMRAEYPVYRRGKHIHSDAVFIKGK